MRLVHRLKVDQAVAVVPVRDSLPHGPKGRQVVDLAVLERAGALPVTEDHLEPLVGGGLDCAGVRPPEGAVHGVRIDRQPHRVRAQVRREPADDRAGFRICRGIGVRRRQARGHHRVIGEVIPRVRPVHAPELVGSCMCNWDVSCLHSCKHGYREKRT